MRLRSEDKINRHLDTIRIGRNICFGGGSSGGGSAGPTTNTTNTSNLPEYLQPYVTRNVAAAEAVAGNPYQGYGSQRTADFSNTQQQVQANLMGMQTPSQFGVANQATTDVLNNSWTNPGTASAFMNPYQQNVTDIQKREAARQSDIQGVGSDAQFAKAGAFGGSRQGVVDAERQRNLAQQQNDIQAQGSNQAYQQGMQQYNAQQAQTAGAAQQMAGLGVGQQAADLSRLQAQEQTGATQQGTTQQMLDQAYQDFINQRDYGKQQVNWMTGVIHGTPTTAQSNVVSTTTGAAPNTMGQLTGLGIAGMGAYSASQKQA
jgi:hypothetical protein